MRRLLALLLLLPGLALAQVYPYFPPPYAQGNQSAGQFLGSPCSGPGPITLRSLCASDFTLGFLAPLTLQLTDPNIYGTPASGKQALYNVTTLDNLSSGGTYIANYVAVNDNGAQDSATYGRTIEFDMLLNSAALTGNRSDSLFYTHIIAPTGNAAQNGTPNTYGTLNSTCQASANDNGTGLTTTLAGGACSTFNFISIMDAAATNWYSLGGELDTKMLFGSSVVIDRGLEITKLASNQARGTQEDCALCIGSQAMYNFATTTNVAVSGTGGQFSCTCANVQVGDSIQINGVNTGSGSISGYVTLNQYYVSATDGISTFTLQNSSHGAITTTVGTLTGLTFRESQGAWGWKFGLAASAGAPSVFPFALDATIIGSEQAGTVANIIDFHLVNCTTDALQLTGGMLVDCSGNISGPFVTTTAGATLAGGSVQINAGSPNSTLINTGPAATSGATIGGINNNTGIGGTLVLSQAGGLSNSTWGLNGIVLKGTAQTLTDSSGSGTIGNEVADALPVYTFASSSALTITDVAELYVPAPLAGANVTATNLWSLKTAGGILDNGALTVTGAAVVGSPTGGSQGAGTVNATGLFVNGVAVGNGTGANPTATVGTSAVNGVATTFLRSDGAPAINLTMAPTWTAVHTFSESPASNTSTDGVVLTDPVAATAANQQFSPRTHYTGQGWKTNATAASQTVDVITEAVPVQGAANPTVNYNISDQVNGAGYNLQATLAMGAASTGQWIMPGGSTTAPSYSFSGLTTYGLFCCITVNGSGGVAISSSNTAVLVSNAKGVYANGVSFAASGTVPTVAGCGSSTAVGGQSAFTFSCGTGASPATITVTFANAQVHDFICVAQDRTSNIMLPETTGQATNTCVFKGNIATSDVVSVWAVGR